jgi:leucyl-tRNA synthetase
MSKADGTGGTGKPAVTKAAKAAPAAKAAKAAGSGTAAKAAGSGTTAKAAPAKAAKAAATAKAAKATPAKAAKTTNANKATKAATSDPATKAAARATAAAAAAAKAPASEPPGDVPPFRYTAALANEIEERWQDYWEEHGTFYAPNPVGDLADPSHPRSGSEKLFVLDMFPYPSGAGLHVGHPLGYIGTDCYGRYQRMAGRNVLHAMGFDAFGLPAEQFAVQTGKHPRLTTEDNIRRYRAQLRRLGLAHDPRRSVATTDVPFYRWTQWIFLQIFNAWYDPVQRKARRISELIEEFERGERSTPDGRPWTELSDVERRRIIDDHRLAYVSEAPVNWCPGLGTVLANEEVTSEGRSERGNFPVFKRNLKQWMMRITAYADRLLEDLDKLDWPEPVKQMQRHWIGRSTGAHINFPCGDTVIRVFTTRPDTIFGATYMVVAPEHEIVDSLVPAAWPKGTKKSWTGGHKTPAEAVAAYRAFAARKTEAERTAESREKTGVFIGAYATNPVNGAKIPVFIADYVLAGYGTGAIMAVPGQDERDWEFAEVFDLPIIRTVQPPEDFDGKAYTGEGPAINSANPEVGLDLNGLGVAEAKAAIIEWLEREGHGEGAVTYRLRDWLFSRQRYWGEPFPIVYDETGLPIALPESMLPVELPEVDDFSPRTFDPDDADTTPEPPLSRAKDWVEVTLDLGDGPKRYRRETNTMPQWAGSCWYELRYLDPANDQAMVDPANERYWMGPTSPDDCGGVDLYVGGVEHAVLHLLYARFWHKVLYDLGYVSSSEPFRRLYNQGYIQAYAYTDSRGVYVPAEEVEERDGAYYYKGQKVNREYGKMGKSLKNVVTPDEMCATYGADTFRVYEMSMGPLDVSRPWETRAVVGSYRFLQRVWRLVVDENTGETRVVDAPMDPETERLLHRTIHGVRSDMENLRFNTAIAKLIELTNRATAVSANGTPRALAEPLVLMLSPFAPHLGEELWRRLGHEDSVAYVDYPTADPALLVAESVTYPVQVNGKVRARIQVPADADEEAVRTTALGEVAGFLDGRTPKKVIVVPGRMVSVVV